MQRRPRDPPVPYQRCACRTRSNCPIELSAFGMGQRPYADHTAFINTERTWSLL